MCNVNLNECYSRARLVDLPNIEPLVLVQALVKLVGRVSLGQDSLTSLGKLDSVRICHFTDDTINSIDGSRTPARKNQKYRILSKISDTLIVWTPTYVIFSRSNCTGHGNSTL